MINRIVGSVLGQKIAREREKHPVAAAVIGGATMLAARRFLPARIALLGGTIAAGYLTKKWAEREIAREQADTSLARARTNSAGVADINVPSSEPQPVLPAAKAVKKPAPRKPPAPKAPGARTAKPKAP